MTAGPERLELRALLIWSVALLYVVFQFGLQMSIGVFADQLVTSLETTAAGVGVITALFALSYAAMQVPAGVLLDERSPRRLMTLGLGACAVSALTFSVATDAVVAATARLVMGVGASFGFVGTAVLVARFIPARHFALFIGLTEAAGMLGAASIDEIVAWLLERLDWRDVVRLSGVYGAALAGLLWAVVRDRPASSAEDASSTRSDLPASSAFRALLRSPSIWLIGLYYALALGAVIGFAGLWNVPFQRAFGIGLSEAATANSLIFVGMAAGCPLAGWLADRLGRRRPVVLVSLLGHFTVLALILYTQLLPPWMVFGLRFGLGFFAAGNVLAFVMAADHAPAHLRGTAIGVVNTFGFLGVTLAQLGPGLLLGSRAAPDVPEYVAVLRLLLVGLVIGGGLLLLVKEAPRVRSRSDQAP